jgi:hypothetical protein
VTVDGNHTHIGIVAAQDLAENQTADTAETIDCDRSHDKSASIVL